MTITRPLLRFIFHKRCRHDGEIADRIWTVYETTEFISLVSHEPYERRETHLRCVLENITICFSIVNHLLIRHKHDRILVTRLRRTPPTHTGEFDVQKCNERRH